MSQANQPKWIEKILNLYQAGIAHSFILHFNVNDYVSAEAMISPITYLSKLMAGRIVVVYSRDQGITFPLESMQKKALEILGLSAGPGSQSQPQQLNPGLAALQSIGMITPSPVRVNESLPREPGQALPLLDELLRYVPTEKEKAEGLKGVAVIIENTEFFVPDASLAMMSPDDRTSLATIARWGKDNEIVGSGNLVFLMTGNIANINSDLKTASNRYEAIEIGLPETSQRRAFISQYCEKKKIILADGLTIDQVANSTAGLSLMQIEDILLRAIKEYQLTRNLIWDRKKDIIRGEFGDVLEVIEPRLGFEDIGGLDYIKDFFTRSVIRPIQRSRKDRMPMGVLMTGPAGTGKSIMAEAIAKEAGVNAVKLRIGGQIASKWQGEGERNLEKALRAISGLAPTIVFIDEIDQAMQRGNGDGGSQQDQRIFQRLLEYMSDTNHRGEVVFLAATNRPDLMDAALKRPGRFDKKIPFLVPDAMERESIFKVMARRYLKQDCQIPAGAIKATEGWTGAEIEAVAVKAVELVEDYEMEACQALEEATKRLRPATADIELMTLLAVKEVSDSDLLPARYREMKDNPADLDKKVESLRSQEGTRSQRTL